MIVGVPKEIKPDEYRVGLTPAGAEILAKAGHQVLIETQAGVGSGITDDQYARSGGKIVDAAAEVWQRAELVIKVKEPQPVEIGQIQDGQTIFTYFHFAASRELTEAILKTNCVAVTYETIENDAGQLPLLTPMSEVAGKMSIQEAAKYLERPMMGRGILLGGVPGVEPADVLILGGGVVGTNAAKVAAGLGARVFVLDINLDRLRYLDDILPPNVHTLMCNAQNIRDRIRFADLTIGAVLRAGGRTPVLVTRPMLRTMRPGSVIVDVAVDQGGCIETSHPTTHSDPTFVLDGVIHYCVGNMPGAVGRTSTYALSNATLPYGLALANQGWQAASRADPALRRGLNIVQGRVTNPAVADTFGLTYEEF